MAAAFAGLLGGTTARLNAQPLPGHSGTSPVIAGALATDGQQLPKHACKGQNDCKGQGGGDKKHAGKNSCKGQGACATDGSKPPKEVWPPLQTSCPTCTGEPRELMPANRFNGFTDYGVGIGLRVPHYDHILSKKPVVDWFEIISENYMVDGGRPLKILDQILDQYRVVQHGVSMYFGSAQPLKRDHLKRIKELTKRTNTPWLSDHLCWGSVDGRYTHDLLPLPYTFEAVRTTAERIRMVQDYLETPIAVENVSSYAEYHESEMTEWEFLNEVVQAADCGILLDVNNIYVSSQNHEFDPMEYVNRIPAERVAQIHVAGHSKFEKYILDTHDHPVLDPVWRLYARAIERCGPTSTLLEWDDNIPTFEEVHAEALKANQFLLEGESAQPQPLPEFEEVHV
jgi:uncharacterized protein (UPF0276 family)